METQKTTNSQNYTEKKRANLEVSCSDFKLYYKVTVIKVV